MKRIKGAKEMFHIPWRDMLYYDETSPSGLRHARDITYGNGNTLFRARKDDAACSTNYEGYYVYSSSKYGKFLAHRIIWIICNNSDIPNDCLVDHVDGDNQNNKLSNLRLLKEATNTRNAKLYVTNTSGIVGVYFDTKNSANGWSKYYWKASWMELDGTQKTKAFSIEKFGLLPAMKMACEYRLEQIRKLNEDGAGYTDRHGK